MFVHPIVYEFGIRFLYFDGLKILKQMIGQKKKFSNLPAVMEELKNFSIAPVNIPASI
jgi:hypothetical protein